MAFDTPNGYPAARDLQNLSEISLPIFNVEPVQLQFSIGSDFVAAQVANNVLVLALSNGRIIRIDLDNPEEIDDIDLPKKPHEVGVIRRMFLDPTASHLIICTAGGTASGENYYLHTQSRQPKQLSRLRGVSIECIAWNPSLPTASTREILIGTSDGNIYEAYIETASEFYRKEDKYLKTLQKVPDGPVTGLWVDVIPSKPGTDVRRVVISTQDKLLHLVGKIGKVGHEGGASIYTRLFETEQPFVHEISKIGDAGAATLVVSPDSPESTQVENLSPDRSFAWISSQGVYYGRLLTSPSSPDLGNKVLQEAKLLPKSQLPLGESASGRKKAVQDSIDSIALTQWHILHLLGGRLVAVNRLDDRVIFDQLVLSPGQKALGLFADQQKNTYWLFTTQEIFEITVNDEDRDVWKVMLKAEHFDAALRYAKGPAQKDAVATASGDYLVSKGSFLEAAGVYGKSSKPFEQVALIFIDNNQQDALRKFLLTKITTFKKTFIMQRIMIASWLVEVFMSKLNSLDDTIITKAELSETLNPEQSKDQLNTIRTEFQEFVKKYKNDLDQRTTYDIISSHGREDELLFFASTVNDYNYVLSYWIQRERWKEALDVLKKQTDPEIFYRYSSGLIAHVATDLVDILMRHPDLKARNLIPALLNYDRNFRGPLSQNQAVRYLLHVINQLNSTDAAVHNTLISIYAAHPNKDETDLLNYLETQGDEPNFDSDFALRLCIEHSRVQACVHVYSTMGQYLQAVELALSHSEIDLASLIADRPVSDPSLRKKLWLAVAKKVISQANGIKTAIDFLKRCDLLKIEDLIPFFPDFVVIDDFKEEICAALEDYSRNIDNLKKEMDESSQTATNIKIDISALDHRYAIVEPGEKCYVCTLPLLSRQFFVFPCQHAFHSDCLGKKVIEQAGLGKGKKIKELQTSISKGMITGARRDAAIAELDGLVASACILCSDFAIKKIDEPFLLPTDDLHEWAL
ncbi:vacuolar protein sorting protein-like protein DigA [Bisporella sp. PMI_857]|nr:vacuolar protein sorting protein-like protein DigA [Bisporella sp. PMI_857]